MPKPLHTPDGAFDRTWRPPHPYRPKLSGKRRLIMLGLFIVLSAMIGAYWYFTNPQRVRLQAEQYLSGLTGGYVHVGGATMSIFEGLRLDDVQVHTDPSKSPESVIFTASTFLIQCKPASLLSGKLEATRIVAIDPHVRLREDAVTHQWNYSLLLHRPAPTSGGGGPPIVLPEVSLRNAMVDYVQVGNADRHIGSVNIDGQLSANPGEDRYTFKLQSRGGNTMKPGPGVEGSVSTGSGEVQLTLVNVGFGDNDLQAMLPAQVLAWWEDHKVAGGVRKTELWMNPSLPDRPFRAAIELEKVSLTMQPGELLSHEEIERRGWAQQALSFLNLSDHNTRAFSDHLSSYLSGPPITLKDVDGLFTFTQEGIDINNLTASVEGSRFSISGHYDGYRNDAPASLKLSNVPNQNVMIPAKPQFIDSLPSEVREVYTRFRPMGSCTISAEYVRPAAGAKPQVTGEINVIDGQFTFEKFPYPICRAAGKIAVMRDPKTGEESLHVEHIHGHGLPGGPNQNATIDIDGGMGPFTQSVEVNMSVRGKNISAEPAFLAAFPPRTREALAYFDAPGKGEFPKFKGNFACTIHRYPEVESRWDIETSIHLLDGAGSLVAFPYPMEHISGDLLVSEDRLVIQQARMSRGGADLTVKGHVDWKHDSARPSFHSALTIAAHNIPIDQDLVNALPPASSKWLNMLGAGGKFDLTGEWNSASQAPPDFHFDLALHDCALLSDGETAMVNGVNGHITLTSQNMLLNDIHAKRGDSDLSAAGKIDWPGGTPRLAMTAEAKNLVLDQQLYDVLPEPAQKSWQAIQPKGTVDAKISFKGIPPEQVASAVDVSPTTQPAGQSFELVLTPRNLSITPHIAPYRIDGVTGSATITPTMVKLIDVAGHHGSAEVHCSGTGSTDPNGAWELQLSGAKMLVDDDFKKAVPAILQSLLHSSKMQGTIGFEFSKLKIWNDPAVASAATPPTDAKPADLANTNADFAVKLTAADASLTAGVPLSKVNGTADLTGSTRHGKLTDLNGTLDLPSLEFAGRPTTNFRAELAKRPDMNAMRLAKMQAQIVGGQMAGQIDWDYPDAGVSRYAMALVLRNADVRTLTGETLPNVQGQVSASLSLEGNYDDESSRRGGGDIAVSGQQLYKLPLVLGLLQITNLSLPLTSPFNEGSLRYTVDGQRVTFETIELRAKDMMMAGNGHLDFDTGRVAMSFSTQSQSWLNIPVVNDILQGARNELLQVHIRGTIQQPQVSTTSMGTLGTTIDQVFKGGNPPPDLPPVKKPKPQKSP